MTAITEMTYTNSIFSKVSGMKSEEISCGQKVAIEHLLLSSVNGCTYSAVTTEPDN